LKYKPSVKNSCFSINQSKLQQPVRFNNERCVRDESDILTKLEAPGLWQAKLLPFELEDKSLRGGTGGGRVAVNKPDDDVGSWSSLRWNSTSGRFTAGSAE